MDIFERYQTFIVGVIGFVGVIYTISTNARLTRSQHKREINYEKLAIRTALIEELTLLSAGYKERIEKLTPENCEGSVYIPTHVPNDAYIHLMSKIGLLGPKEIKTVMVAYQLACELPIRLGFLVVNADSTQANRDYIKINNSEISTTAELHKRFLLTFKEALTVLKEKVE